MELSTKKITIEESNLNIQDGRRLIFRLLDNQILGHKMQFQTEWERDHNLSPKAKNAKIDKLEAFKNQLRDLFLDHNIHDDNVNFSIDLKVEVKDQKKESHLMAS